MFGWKLLASFNIALMLSIDSFDVKKISSIYLETKHKILQLYFVSVCSFASTFIQLRCLRIKLICSFSLDKFYYSYEFCRHSIVFLHSEFEQFSYFNILFRLYLTEIKEMALENRLLLRIGCGFLSTTCLFYILANILPMWFVKFSFI
jgi:hypothetical protein